MPRAGFKSVLWTISNDNSTKTRQSGRMKSFYPGIAALLALMSAPLAHSTVPAPAELADADAWARAKFEGVSSAKAPEAGLFVVANHAAVQLNGRFDKPLRVGGSLYGRGLYCHAPSELIVRLPGPGRVFTSTAGIDSNEQTAGGQGSVVFSVGVAGKSVFKTEMMREGMAGTGVRVGLEGARELVLEVSDGGNGIACDQADWADAKVVLADGQTVWLGDLPIYSAESQPVSVEPFFSFTYGGKPSAELLKSWNLERTSRTLDDQRKERTLIYTDPKTGLIVRCVGVQYNDFPTVEWTLYFKNAGTADTPILADIQAIDSRFVPCANGDFTLHYTKGDSCTPDSFEPLTETLGPAASKQLAPAGGRPTSGSNPYWNFHNPGNGLIVVLGWPGQWAARFDRDDTPALRIRAGQQLTHFTLHPAEEVRSPLVVVQFYRGDWLRGQNLWRRWMIAHNMPRPGGRPPPILHAGCSSHQFAEMCNATTRDQIQFIDRYIEEDLKPDYWWMDAGWYPCDGFGWWKTGTWEVDTRRFPNGLREVSDYAHSKNLKTIVWFEPERVHAGTWLTEQHPEWVIGGTNSGLLNLGNPDAWNWLNAHVNGLIDAQGIDLYRQDFNFDPLNSWRGTDTPDRQGITEIKHLTGYLAYWDELRKRHPGMLIDSCASGGRRNDIETLRRAVPLYRTDYILQPTACQGHTYGMALWIPYFGTGERASDLYALRSAMCPSLITLFDVRRKDLSYDLVRRALSQWRQFAPYYMGDYYPLTSYSLDNGSWMAWQFNCPDTGEGVVQAFRRPESPYTSVELRLKGLEPEAVYTVSDLDLSTTHRAAGSRLMQEGLAVAIKDQPGSAVFLYKKKP